MQLNVFGLVKMVYWAFMPLIKGCPCFFKDVLLGVHGFQGLFMDFKGLEAVSVFFLKGCRVLILFSSREGFFQRFQGCIRAFMVFECV